MAANKLKSLIEKFRPRRTYKNGNITTEVDGIFVRIDESMRVREKTLIVPVEDFLQDAAIIRSARVSTGRDAAAVNEKAEDLLRSLYKNEHVTPFEGAVLFRLKMTAPIYAAQPFCQIFSSHNEQSGRYKEIDGQFAIPPWATKSPQALQILREGECDSKRTYEAFLRAGIAKEQARLALLYRFFTKFYWTISLRHLLELSALEENPFAPKEFWEFRDVILPKLFSDYAPWTNDIFNDSKKCYGTRWAFDIPYPNAIPYIWKSWIENIGTIKLISSSISEDLMRLGVHTGPNPKRGFAHSSLIFDIACPIFVYRQWVRHRYGAWSELPVDFARIVKENLFFIPRNFRKQVGKAMQYRYEDLIGGENERFRDDLALLIKRSCIRYSQLLDLGFSPEQAAIALPYSFLVRRLWTVNIESLMNFFSLRCDSEAQEEIRQFANVIYRWFASRYPWVNEIFLKHLN